MSNYLEIRNLSQHFEFNNEVTPVFDNVSFTLDKGEFLCILGQSGCGKTTLLRCLAGLIKPTDGEIHIEGTPVKNPGKHCAMVFQTFDQLLPWKKVLDNVVFPLRIQNKDLSKSQLRSTAEEYLDMVGLSDFLDYFPHQLSGGMKQRVAIARALALKPSLILMDEPFASLDSEMRMGLQKALLRAWDKSGATVLFVTHSIIEAISLSTKMMVMGSGSDKGIRLFIDNSVEGERTGLRNPQSPGYTECWSQVSEVLRGDQFFKNE